MKNKISSLFILITLILFSILLFNYSSDVMSQVTFSVSLWKDKLLPSLLPLFLFSELLISYGFIELMGGMLGKFFSKVLYVPGEASFAIIASMVSGFPSGSKYVRDLYDNNYIDNDTANYLLTFTHFANPMFVMGMIGTYILGNKSLGFTILIAHIIGNVVIALIFRRKKEINYNYSNIRTIFNKVHKKRMSNDNFVGVLIKSIFKSLKLLVLILGIITFFSIITIIITNLFKLSEFNTVLLKGIFEMTQGINSISYINIPVSLKASLITMFISFGGVSVHFQVKSIIDGCNIKYKYFLIARIIHSIISGILVFILIN